MNASHIRLYYKISDKLIGFEINKKTSTQMAIQKLKNFHENENEIENIKIGLEKMKMNRRTESKVISLNELKFTLGLKRESVITMFNDGSFNVGQKMKFQVDQF